MPFPAICCRAFLLLGCGFTIPGHAAALQFAPHEAVYELHLEQNRPNSQVLRADGTLTYSFGDACDGWTTNQKLELKLLTAQGGKDNISVTSSAWEARDGTALRFTSRTLNNGQESEVFRGHAQLSATGGEATFTLPKASTMKIPAGAMFPNQHTQLILTQALKGEKVPNQLVFDGTDEQGQSDISVFLSRPVSLEEDKSVPAKLRADPLLQGKAYPVHLAFFSVPLAGTKPDDADDMTAGTPDYELKLDLLPNSIARQLWIDYGNFTVRGTISALKSLPASGCDNR